MRATALLLSLLLISPGCEQPPAERAAPRLPVDAGATATVIDPVAKTIDAAVVTAVVVADAGPEREPVDLEPGRWKLGLQDLCVEVFADHTIEVAVEGPMDRNPVRIGGRYRAVPGEPDTFRVTIEAPRLLQKQLTSCRKSWEDTPIERRELLGITVKDGRAFTLTLRLIDGGAQLEVCSTQKCAVLDRTQRTSRTTALEEM